MSNLSDSWPSPAGGDRGGAMAYVMRDLRDGIAAGVVRVGDRLPSEHALAARYGVSRTVIREVLRVLETQGLTVTHTGRGTFVASREAVEQLRFGSYSAVDLMEARPHFEIAAAGLAAIRRTESHVDALQTLHERMEAASDAAEWVRLDVELHAAIATASGNPVFSDVLAQIGGALVTQSTFVNVSPGRQHDSDAEHRAIIAAIARRSVTEAEDAMQFHLDQVKEVLLSPTRR